MTRLLAALFTTDHKVIGRRFLFAGLSFLLLGGALAMVIRWQWAFPGQSLPGLGRSGPLVSAAGYQSTFTMHGLVMIFWAITPILINAFGNFSVPLLIGARRMSLPGLSAASFWIFVLSQALVLASFVMPLGAASAGWTSYPPLSTRVGVAGAGQTLVLMALALAGLSTVLGAVNLVSTVFWERAPGMGFSRLPLSVWGLTLTSILNVLFVPVVLVATLLLLSDRLLGTEHFIAGAAARSGRPGDPVLYQHLFWIFGHPEVYVLILPVWGFIGDFLSFFARKPAYWYRGTVVAMAAVTTLSALVYGHHMFTSGMAPLLGKAFMALTLLVSAPSVVLVVNFLQTLWGGSARFPSPMLYALGTLFVFGLGGLTGLYLGAISTDLYLHDTLFVVGHFHLTMAAASFLGAFAALHFWFPKMFGRALSEPLAKIHFWGSVIFLTLTFGGQLLAGYSGQHRRLYDPYQYEFLRPLLPLNQLTSAAAFTLGAFQLVFIFNFFRSLFRGAPARGNHWQVGTLEWTHTASPPIAGNFESLPTVLRGPHEYNHPEALPVLGRDWLGQSEPFPPPPTGLQLVRPPEEG